jgi:SAM-dependent methyltransferase
METVKINLGSGLQQAPGWINYDRSRSAVIARNPVLRRLFKLAGRPPLDWPEQTRVRDLTKGIPHATGSVDVVYSSHFLEHLPRDHADALVRESFRVLRPDGWMRLVVPDLEVLARAYASGDRAYFRNDEPTIADAFMASLYLGIEKPPRSAIRRFARWLLRSDEGGHRWMYDAASLIHRMQQAGFAEVQAHAYREGRSGAEDMDTQPRSTVYIEGRKPAKTGGPVNGAAGPADDRDRAAATSSGS